MARPLRMERAGAWYHVTVRGTEYDWGRNMIGVVTSDSRGGTHQRLLGMIVGMIGVASIHYTFYEISLAKYGVPWPSRCELSRIERIECWITSRRAAMRVCPAFS